jgi:hypothetical protein
MSEGGSARKTIDSAWRHGKPMDNNRFGSICNYCGQVMKSGGVSRLKEHLAGGHKNVKDCPNVPREVRQEMMDALKSGIVRRIKQKDIQRETFEHLRHGRGGPSSDDDDDDDDGIMYPPDVVTEEEKREYREAIRASKEARREEEQRRNFRGSGGASGSRNMSAATLRRSQSTRHTPSIDPFVVRTCSGRQKFKRYGEGGNGKGEDWQVHIKVVYI